MRKINRVLKDYHKIDIHDIQAEIRAISQAETSAISQTARNAETWAMVSGITKTIMTLPEMSLYMWSLYDRARATNLANKNNFGIVVSPVFDKTDDTSPLIKNLNKNYKYRLKSMQKKLFRPMSQRRFTGFKNVKKAFVRKKNFLKNLRGFNRRTR